MRFGSLFFSVVHLFLSFLLMACGVAILMIPLTEQFRESLMHLIDSRSIDLVIFGSLVALFGLFLMVLLFFAYKRHVLVLTMGSKLKVSVDEKALQKYVGEYWKELFPKMDVHSTLYVRRNQIYITADIPSSKSTDYEHLLQKIEEGLADLFEKYFQYTDEFHLNVSFRDAVSSD
ncbi:MAG: hypothetical protein P4L16_07545 [Chlamydiales bacterium]|nr:hypothetical protein [Chlamydiales bacterium]